MKDLKSYCLDGLVLLVDVLLYFEHLIQHIFLHLSVFSHILR